MPLANPIAIYNAGTNQEALFLRHLQNQAGIEAAVAEDLSLVGLWIGGTVPGLHLPQIWVDSSQAEDAAVVLREYEQQRTLRQESEASIEHSSEGIETVCEACGELSLFPSIQRGSVQNCPKCGTMLDVGVSDDDTEWWNVETEEDKEETG